MRFERYSWCALVCAVVIACAPASAQLPVPGSRVRIAAVSPASQTEGIVVASTADTIRLQPGLGGGPLLSLPMDSVRTIDRSEGIHSSFGTVMKDAGIGAAIGVGAVALVGTATCHISSDDLCTLNAVAFGISAAAVGFVTGALIGSGEKRETWTRVFTREQSTSLLIGSAPRGGVALGLSFAFGGEARVR